MSNLILVQVYGNEVRVQRAWQVIRTALKLKRFHADAILVDGPVYVKSQGGYVEVTIQDNR